MKYRPSLRPLLWGPARTPRHNLGLSMAVPEGSLASCCVQNAILSNVVLSCLLSSTLSVKQRGGSSGQLMPSFQGQ